LSATVMFAPFNFEGVVLLPQDSRALLLDVKCVLHGQPAFLQGPLGVGVDDVRVYIDTIEITDAVTSCLRKAIDKADQAKLKAQYRTALDQWLAVEAKLGASHPGDTSHDAEIADKLVNTVPLSTTLDRLGNRKTGASGNLHIFNFLYSQIDIA